MTHKLKVYIQKNQRSWKDTDPVPSLIEITDRIPRNALTELSEKMEQGRFSFCANDISIDGIANSDGFMSSVSEYMTYGFFVYIRYDGNEVYRGYVNFQDVSFSDARPRTFSLHSYNWLSLLKDHTLAGFMPSAYTLTAFREAVQYALVFPPPPFRPYFDSRVEFDVDGLSGLSFKANLGWYDENTEEIPAHRDVEQLHDIWQNPRTKRIYGLRLDNADLTKAVVVELLCNSMVEVFRLDVTTIGESYRFKGIPNHLRFIRSNMTDDVIGIKGWCVSSIVPDRRIIATMRTDGRMLGFTTSASDIDESHYLVKPDGMMGYYTHSVISDGYVVAAILPLTSGQFQLGYHAGLTNTIVEWSTNVPAASKAAISMPDRDTVVFFEALGGRWKWFSRGSSVINTGAMLPDADAGAEITRIWPSGQDNPDYTGQYCYWVQYDSDVYEVYQGRTNDPFFLVFSGLRYDDKVSLMDILLDFAQAFNCYLFTHNGVLYLKNREKYAAVFGFSTDYISTDNYERRFSDESSQDVYLSFTSKYFTDTDIKLQVPSEPHNFTGILSNYYRNTYSARWAKRSLAVPLPAGFQCNLGDKIEVTETGEKGIVIERRLDFDKGTAEFTMESRVS